MFNSHLAYDRALNRAVGPTRVVGRNAKFTVTVDGRRGHSPNSWGPRRTPPRRTGRPEAPGRPERGGDPEDLHQPRLGRGIAGDLPAVAVRVGEVSGHPAPFARRRRRNQRGTGGNGIFQDASHRLGIRNHVRQRDRRGLVTDIQTTRLGGQRVAAPQTQEESRADLDEADVVLDLERRRPAQAVHVEPAGDGEVAHAQGQHAHRGIHAPTAPTSLRQQARSPARHDQASPAAASRPQ